MSKPLPDPADSFQRIEVITGTGRRRQWPDDVKTAIVAKTLQEGAVITEIARRHRVSASQIFNWRKKARERVDALTAEGHSRRSSCNIRLCSPLPPVLYRHRR